MNRRQLLQLGALAVAAPKAMAAPVVSTWPADWTLARQMSWMAKHDARVSVAYEAYQSALAAQILVVARTMGSRGLLYRSAPTTALPGPASP